MFAKVHPAEDVKSGNTGSCHDLVRYLEKETATLFKNSFTVKSTNMILNIKD